MNKKFVTLIITILGIFALSFALVACDKPSGDSGDKPSGDGGKALNGTYYYCENDELDYSLYITFKNGKWTDDENQSGEYSFSDDKVTLYIEKDEYASGTVDGDDITLYFMGAEWLYRKGPDIDPTAPKEKTLDYKLSDDKTHYTVKGIGGLTGDVVVPDEYKKKPVTEIAEGAFANKSELTSIVIGNNVTSVGEKAFYKCANLTTATLGESVDGIAASTFEECRALTTVTIPLSVKSIGKTAFRFCLKLKDIYYTGSESDWAQIDFYYSVGYNTIEVCNPIYDGATYIVGNNTASVENVSRNLYIDGELLTDAEIYNADTVSPFAFYGYRALKSVAVGGDVQEIGQYAFYDCASLDELSFSGDALKKVCKGAFSSCGSLLQVSLPSGLKVIDEYAFNSCGELKSVNTGNGVAVIEYGAFMSCGKLNSLTLGRSVAEIGEAAFYACEELTEVTIPESVIFIGKDAFFGSSVTSAKFVKKDGWIVNKDVPLESAQLEDEANAAALLVNSVLMQGYADTDWERPTLQYILSDDQTYYTVNNVGTGCRSNIVIPATYNDKPVKAIADSAFSGCSALMSITIPDSVISIGRYAFNNCSGLSSITIPNGVETIGEFAFFGCRSLSSIIVGTGLKEIGYSAFVGYLPAKKVYYTGDIAGWCQIEGLDDLINSETTLYIGGEPLSGNLVIPNGVTAISYYAFAYNRLVTSVTLPATLTSIGGSAFSNCDIDTVYFEGDLSKWCEVEGLNNLVSNETTVYIGGKELSGNVVIPSGVTAINSGALYFADRVTSVTIPNSVTFIGSDAFNDNITTFRYEGSTEDLFGVSGLNNIMKKELTLYINGEKFNGSIVVPSGITEIADYQFSSCFAITSVVIPDSVVSIGDSAFYYCRYLTSATIGNGVKTIGPRAFYVCDSLTTLTLGNSLEEIGENAFYLCDSLKSVVLPDSVVSIGAEAFDGCDSLESVTFGSSLKTIGNEAFAYCGALKSITLPDGLTTIGSKAFYGCSSIENVVIPDSVTAIYERTFTCAALTTVTIGKGVQSIGAYAFTNDGRRVTLTYTGTYNEWINVKKNSNWTSGMDSYVMYVEGEIISQRP
ncbi:MAG: leucine-rich repeat domain-containing protein [Clostridiales bacterium]|nr:leucine-rich repeat domain-containing protein [Clostridiales bacterium]